MSAFTGLAPQVGRMMTDESIKASVLCMGARTTTSNASAAVVPTSLEELRRLALQMGCVLEPISKWARTVAHSVATALRTREGDFIYQSAALRIVEMPRDAAVAIFPTPREVVTAGDVLGVDLCLRDSSIFSELAAALGDANGGRDEGNPTAIRAGNSRDGNDDGRSGDPAHHFAQWEQPSDDQLSLRADGRDGRSSPTKRSRTTRDRAFVRGGDGIEAAGANRCEGSWQQRSAAVGGVVAATGGRNTRSSCRVAPRQLGGDARGGTASGDEAHRDARHVRGVGHPRGEEERLAQGGLGGIPPGLGGVAQRRRGGESSDHVGTPTQGETHDRLPGVAGEDGEGCVTESCGESRRQRCQRPFCLEQKKKAYGRVKDLEAELRDLRPLRTNFDRLLAEAMRTADAEIKKAREDVAQRGNELRKANNDRNYNLSKLKKSEETITYLMEKVAALSAELLVLRKDEEARLKRDAVTARRREADERRELELSARLQKEEVKIRLELQRRAEAADEAATAAGERLEEARAEAAKARAEAMEEAEAAERARAAKTDAEYASLLATRQAERAKAKANHLAERLEELGPRPHSRSPEEWAQLKAGARRKARERDCAYLRSLVESHRFRAEDIATVLSEKGLLKSIMFKCREGFNLYFEAVRDLIHKIEVEHFGDQFALFLHFELRMPLQLIHRLVQAGCKMFERQSNMYQSKPLLCHPWIAKESIQVRHTLYDEVMFPSESAARR